MSIKRFEAGRSETGRCSLTNRSAPVRIIYMNLNQKDSISCSITLSQLADDLHLKWGDLMLLFRTKKIIDWFLIDFFYILPELASTRPLRNSEFLSRQQAFPAIPESRVLISQSWTRDFYNEGLTCRPVMVCKYINHLSPISRYFLTNFPRLVPFLLLYSTSIVLYSWNLLYFLFHNLYLITHCKFMHQIKEFLH